MSVKTYDWGFAEMDERDDGDYVLLTDYESLQRELDSLMEKYNELLYCVSNKYEGETRHESAKRLIKIGEIGNGLYSAAKESTQ